MPYPNACDNVIKLLLSRIAAAGRHTPRSGCMRLHGRRRVVVRFVRKPVDHRPYVVFRVRIYSRLLLLLLWRQYRLYHIDL